MIEIEVCERLMDHRIVPVIVEDRVTHLRSAPKYHAQIKGQPGVWACGISWDDAIGNLVRYHPEEFGVTITDLGKQAR
jgi:hypothetical protein